MQEVGQLPTGNVDTDRVAAFDAKADVWWDPAGAAAWLHRYNLVRIPYIQKMACARFGRDERDGDCLRDLRIIDVGCGAGVLCEPLARLGATVSGIDAAERVISQAQQHARAGGLAIDYSCTTSDMVLATGARFDAVISMEVIEHVPDRTHFVKSCAALVKPGGLLIMSTINRTPKSFIYAIIFGEYILRMLPIGTHRWDWFVRPDEIAAFAASDGLVERDLTGIVWSLVQSKLRFARDTQVNYMICLEKVVERIESDAQR